MTLQHTNSNSTHFQITVLPSSSPLLVIFKQNQQGGKKGKKDKKVVEVHDPRWDEIIGMNEETLRDKIANLKARLEKSMIDRNYVQLERVKENCGSLLLSQL